jgi:hypothetical protein
MGRRVMHRAVFLGHSLRTRYLVDREDFTLLAIQ